MIFYKKLAFACAAALCALTASAGEGIIPLEAQVEGRGTPAPGIYFKAIFEIEVGRQVVDVLHRGITLTFVLDVQVDKKRWYWFDRNIAGVRETMRLSFNPLTRRYKLSVGAIAQNFDSLESALQLMESITNLYVGAYRQLDADDYTARARLYLDSTQLPRPLQVVLDKGWNLDSGWFAVKVIPTKGGES